MKFEDTFPQLHWFKYSEMSNFQPNVGYDLESSYYRATEILWNKLYENVIMMKPPLANIPSFCTFPKVFCAIQTSITCSSISNYCHSGTLQMFEIYGNLILSNFIYV